MARIAGRQARRGSGSYTALHVRLVPAYRARIKAAAQALGISEAEVVDEILSRFELDGEGRPVWWRDPIPAPRDQTDEAQAEPDQERLTA